jgi:hypothetical protein
MRPYPIQSGDQKIKWDFIRDAPADRSAGRCTCPQTAWLSSTREDTRGTTLSPTHMKEARPDQTRPDQTRPDQTRPDQTRRLACL